MDVAHTKIDRCFFGKLERGLGLVMMPTPTSLAAVFFDWTGTIVDFGSCAPMADFVQLFARYDIALRIEEASGPPAIEAMEARQPRNAELVLKVRRTRLA